jgi:TPR repeat protein
MRQLLLDTLGQQATAFLGDPARAAEVVTAVATFLKGGHSLNLLLRPDEPLPLSTLPALFQQAAVNELGLAVLADDDEGVALPALPELDPTSPPEVLAAAAAAYAEGVGVPQNFARARELAARAARAGDPQAMILQARLLTELGNDPEGVSEAYRLASLAAAAGEAEGTALLARLETSMTPDQVSEAQGDALRIWRATGTGSELAAAEAAALAGDVGAMRDLAQAFLAGAGAPKSYEEAYVWASLAAARGDLLAAALRERVVAAARRGVITVNVLAEAQRRAAELWEELPKP